MYSIVRSASVRAAERSSDFVFSPAIATINVADNISTTTDNANSRILVFFMPATPEIANSLQ